MPLRSAQTDCSGCYQIAVHGALWLAERYPLNLNFRFLKLISLLLILTSYSIVLTRLCGLCSRSHTSRKNSRVYPGIEPGTSWMAVRLYQTGGLPYSFSSYKMHNTLWFRVRCSVHYHHHHHHHECSAQWQVFHCSSTQRQVFHRKFRNKSCSFTRDE